MILSSPRWSSSGICGVLGERPSSLKKGGKKRDKGLWPSVLHIRNRFHQGEEDRKGLSKGRGGPFSFDESECSW